MYHTISESHSDETGYYGIATPPRLFAMQMRWLRDNGYMVIGLPELAARIQSGTSKSKCAVLTFDDGYMDFYTHAFPVIHDLGFPATVFLPTSFMDDADRHIRGRQHLGWREVQELAGRDISFGSHTMTHPQLSSLKQGEIEYELRHSKEIIEAKIGQEVFAFSYPFAFPEADHAFRRFLTGCLANCGYGCAVSTRIGTVNGVDDLFCLRRVPVNGDDDLGLFEAKLKGRYDWMGKVQYLSKSIRKAFGTARSR